MCFLFGGRTIYRYIQCVKQNMIPPKPQLPESLNYIKIAIPLKIRKITENILNLRLQTMFVYVHVARLYTINETLRASAASKLVQQFNLKLAHLSARRLFSIFGVRLFSCVTIHEKSDVLRKLPPRSRTLSCDTQIYEELLNISFGVGNYCLCCRGGKNKMHIRGMNR